MPQSTASHQHQSMVNDRPFRSPRACRDWPTCSCDTLGAGGRRFKSGRPDRSVEPDLTTFRRRQLASGLSRG
jgi:hypothetical protein